MANEQSHAHVNGYDLAQKFVIQKSKASHL